MTAESFENISITFILKL